jgi:hypothetical protein
MRANEHKFVVDLMSDDVAELMEVAFGGGFLRCSVMK